MFKLNWEICQDNQLRFALRSSNAVVEHKNGSPNEQQMNETKTMLINVENGGWGSASTDNIMVLLVNTASQINKHMRRPFNGEIIVKWWEQGYPFTQYREAGTGPFTSYLPVQGTLWNQYAYQFSHEFCHILSDCEKLSKKKNQWFHETVCEMASLFTLRSMSKEWAYKAPCSNWMSYASSLWDYAEESIRKVSPKLLRPEELQQWLSENEDYLLDHNNDKDKNLIVAVALLEIFEKIPGGWNTIARFPNSDERFEQYLRVWQSMVDDADKVIINRILSKLGFAA